MFFHPHETLVSSLGHAPSPDAGGSPGQKILIILTMDTFNTQLKETPCEAALVWL